MTDEQAIVYLESLKEYVDKIAYAPDMYGAIDMAIKALEQQPSEDYISRAYIEPIVEELENICINRDEYVLSLLSDIKNAPPVTPQQTRWISVSERLPEEYIHVLCQFTLGGMGECYLAHGVFHVVGGLVMTCNEVIAWMPLPKPYEESEDDE